MQRIITSMIFFTATMGVIFWLVSCCASNNVSMKNRYYMGNQPPEVFFDGPALELAIAINRNDSDAIRRLSPQVEINRVHRQGMTLLFYALTAKKHAAVTELIKVGANPAQIDKELGSPLDLAVQAKESLSLESILDAGVSPNAINSWALHFFSPRRVWTLRKTFNFWSHERLIWMQRIRILIEQQFLRLFQKDATIKRAT